MGDSCYVQVECLAKLCTMVPWNVEMIPNCISKYSQRNINKGKIPLYLKRFIRRNWLMQLWRLRTLTTHCLQDGDPGKPMV